MFKTKYRIIHKKNKFFVQRRFLFFKWINVADYDNHYMAHMVLKAFNNDNC